LFVVVVCCCCLLLLFVVVTAWSGTYLGEVGVVARPTQSGPLLRLTVNASAADSGMGLRVRLFGSDAAEGDSDLDVSLQLEPRAEQMFDLTTGEWMNRSEAVLQYALAEQQVDGLPSSSAGAGAGEAATGADGFEEGSGAPSPSRLPVVGRTAAKRSHLRGRSRSAWLLDFPDARHVTLWLKHVRVTLVQSDGFLNLHDVTLLDERYLQSADHAGLSAGAGASAGEESVLEPLFSQHGVLGQTVVYRRYANRWRFLQGDIDDYSVDSLLSVGDRFSLFGDA
jgi:hypothetical protein